MVEDAIRDARVRLYDLGGLELRRVSPTSAKMFPTAPDFQLRADLYNDLADLHLIASDRSRLPLEYEARLADLCGEGWHD